MEPVEAPELHLAASALIAPLRRTEACLHVGPFLQSPDCQGFPGKRLRECGSCRAGGQDGDKILIYITIYHSLALPFPFPLPFPISLRSQHLPRPAPNLPKKPQSLQPPAFSCPGPGQAVEPLPERVCGRWRGDSNGSVLRCAEISPTRAPGPGPRPAGTPGESGCSGGPSASPGARRIPAQLLPTRAKVERSLAGGDGPQAPAAFVMDRFPFRRHDQLRTGISIDPARPARPNATPNAPPR
jgi:hypothetical protein